MTVSATLQATGRVLASRATMVSDNIVLDVSGAPSSGFDVHSVLVHDGPEEVEVDTGLPLAGTREGNIDNDWLGVDATEAWLLDEQFRVLDADLAMRGVGPAAQLLGAQTRNGTAVHYVLVRPFAMPPFAVGPAGASTLLARDNSKYPFAPGAGRMRVILDVRGDTDGDGLGDRLEAELGLCDGVNATGIGPDDRRVACMLASEVLAAVDRWRRPRIQMLAMSDPRDTDGDGISDAAEVLGTNVVEARLPRLDGGRPGDVPFERLTDASQTFPLWGFDPRHKDILIEMDRSAEGAGCTVASDSCPPNREAYEGAPAVIALELESLWSWRRAWAILPATSVMNPDGRPGIELHFDIRFPRIATRGHRTGPQFVPTDRMGRAFTRAGFLIYQPFGSEGQCSCSPAFTSPDPRHGGLQRYWVAIPGGATSCNAEIIGTHFNAQTVGSHEFGHVMGIDHGGPFPSCLSNPFAPSIRSTDTGLEDKTVYPSLMNYAYDYEVAFLSYAPRFRGQVFSTGYFANTPLPRRVWRGTQNIFGWPERDTLGGDSTSFIGLWQRIGSDAYPYQDSCTDSLTCTTVDFDRDRTITSNVIPNAEPSQAVQAAGTYPAGVYGQVCDSTGRVLGRNGICCPIGTRLNIRGECELPLGSGLAARFPPTSGSAGTLFNVARQGPFLARPTVGLARRMYALVQADLSATDTTGNPERNFTGEGKVRWQAMDRIDPRADPLDPSRFEARSCSSDFHDCARPDASRAERGDFIVDGAPWRLDGPGIIEAATLAAPTGGVETIFAATASRTRLFCSNARRIESECPWGAPRFAIGTSDQLERAGGSFRSVTIPGAPARVAGVAIAPWSTVDRSASRFFVAMRDADDNTLWWTSCDAAGVCAAARQLQSAGLTVQSRTPIALAVQDSSGVRRLALVATALVATAPVLALNEIEPGGGGDVVVSAARRIQDSLATSEVPLARESALSIAFTRVGNLVVGFEAGTSLYQALGSTLADPFRPGAIRLAWGMKEYNTSKPMVRGATAWPLDERQGAFFVTPGTTFALFRDDRPAIESVGVHPVTGERIESYDEAFANVVRAWAAGARGQGNSQRFVGRAEGSHLERRFDYDDVHTLAYTTCQTIENGSRGLRGAGLSQRSARLGNNSRLLCPGAQAWPEPPWNRIMSEIVVRPDGIERNEFVRAIAELVTSPSWYGGAPRDPELLPAINARPAPIPQCSASDPESAWQHYYQQQGEMP